MANDHTSRKKNCALHDEGRPGRLGTRVCGFTLGRMLHAAGMLASLLNIRRVAASLTYDAELAGVSWLLARLA